MKKKKIFLLLLALSSVLTGALAQGTAFSYQGHLLENGAAASGNHDFTFALFDSPGAGTRVGPLLELDKVPVTSGQFSVTLDFQANVFTGEGRWLEISVRPSGVAPFTKMDARASVLPTPYAIYAATAASLANGAVAASQLHTAGPAPKSGQVLSYNGTSLSWTDPGIAAGGIWSVLNNNAYYSLGNVGVGGTATGTSKLQITGADALTLSGAGPYLTWHDTATGKSAAISSAGGTLYYRVPDAAGNVLTAGYVDSNGSVVRGRISLEGAGPYITWNDSISGKSATISSTLGTLYYRVPDAAGTVVTAGYVDSNGSVVRGRLSLEGNAPYITWNDSTSGRSATISSTGGTLNFQVPDAAGKVITAGSVDSSGLEVNGALDVTGATTVTTLRASGPLLANGSLVANGNALQTRERGGLVKAMLFVGADGSIIRCFNSSHDDSVASTVPCNFRVDGDHSVGIYHIFFDFRVDDRFVSITPGRSGNTSDIGATVVYNFSGINSIIEVNTFNSDGDVLPAEFTVIVY